MPSHLLLGWRVLTKLDSDFNRNNMDCDALSRWVHYFQTLIVHYWNRWRQEYLSELHEIKLNKVIIIEGTHVPRSSWKIGQVEEFITIKDGFNRGCKLRVIGKHGHYFIKRPVSKLYPLEIRNSENSVAKNSSENVDVIDYGRASRPKWLAAGRDIDLTIEYIKIDWLIDCLQIKVGSAKKEPSTCFKDYAWILF